MYNYGGLLEKQQRQPCRATIKEQHSKQKEQDQEQIENSQITQLNY